MNTSDTILHCEVCGAALPGGPLDGICPACLMDSAIRDWNDPREVSTEESPGASFDTPLPPHQIGRYHLDEEISRGGTGVVFRATDGALKRTVAVKVLHAGTFASRESVRRLFLEASATARLNHPNIVPIHEVGGGDEGTPYLVMPYLEGGTAAMRWLPGRASERSLKDIAGVMQKIALAVHHAHQHGILHRDLKPGNILFDKEDEPYVADFGLARLLDEDSSLTLSNAVVGTPIYMSPEQASGVAAEMTTASDIHALGVILYEWMAGKPPYTGESIPVLLKTISESEPKSPLTTRMDRVSDQHVSIDRHAKDLETICLKCLEKTPTKRYGSAYELANDLQSWLEDKPILARPVSRLERLWRWCRRNPMAAAFVTAASLLILIVSIGGPIVAAREATLARDVRRLSYASDISTAWHAWDIANISNAVDLLDRHKSSDLREFTWRYLSKLCEPNRTTPFVIDPSRHTWGGLLSRDGKLLVIGGIYGHMTLWDARSRNQIHSMKTGNELVEYAAFSPDASLLVSTGGHAASGSEKNFHVWDTRTGQSLVHLDVPALSGEFSPDGSWFVCGLGDDREGDLAILDPQQNWSEFRQWKAHDSPLWVTRWSHDNRRIVTSGYRDHLTRIWDAASGEMLYELVGHTDTVTAAAFSPDDSILATGSEDTSVRFWDTATGSELPDRNYKHLAGLNHMEWSSNGTWLASCGKDGLIRLQNTESQLEWTLRGHSMWVGTVGFALNNTQLVSVSPDRTIRFWDLADLPMPDTPLEGLRGYRFHAPVALSSDGSIVATTNHKGTEIVLSDTSNGFEVNRWPANASSLSESLKQPIQFTPDRPIGAFEFISNEKLAVAHIQQGVSDEANVDSRFIHIMDIERHRVVNQFEGTEPMALSPGGRFLASNGADGMIRIHDLEQGMTSMVRDLDGVSIFDMAFSPDGKKIAVGGYQRELDGYGLFLVDAMRHRLIEKLKGQPYAAPINALSFTADGSQILSVGLAAKVQVWDVRQRRFVSQTTGHTGHGRALAISPDGRTLATGSNTGVLKLWSLVQDDLAPKELLTVKAHQTAILSLVFARNGNMLASGGRDGNVRLWPAIPDNR